MRSRIVLLVAAAIALAAAPAIADKAIEGSGKLETRTLDVGDFTKIDLGGAFDVEITVGGKTRVEVTIDDNLWENLEADVRKGELALDWKKNCRPDEGCRVSIVTPSLAEFSLHGAGDVVIHDITGPSFGLKLRGAGNVSLSGKVDDLEIMITGAGNCDADRLQATDAKVVISGVGDCDLHAVGSLDAAVSGVGSVTYRGDPEVRRAAVSGMGKVSPR